jgi:hypothetical protein
MTIPSLLYSPVLLAQIPVSAPITSETPGKMGEVASQCVLRVICPKTAMGGTGFLHSSGWIVTAFHVVKDCQPTDLLLVFPSGERSGVTTIKSDSTFDLAILKPSRDFKLPSLKLSTKNTIELGALVTTWGFPSGYNGLAPLLTVGYMSGVDRLQTQDGLSPPRWVVNAAFNGGNSGGPVLENKTGEVIGIVSSKLAPIPPLIESALEALGTQRSGVVYTKTNPDGTTESLSEGQIVGAILAYLRSQTQLVLGHAVTSTDLISFLDKNRIK